MTNRAPSTVALIALLLSTSCARNAVANIDVRIPAQTVMPMGRHWVWIELADEVTDFGSQTFALESPQSVDLNEVSLPHVVQFAVTSSDTTTRLRVRVRYCMTERCASPEDMRALDEGQPGYRYQFERLFYIGAVTSYELTVAALDPATEATAPISTVCRCAVAGCLRMPSASYCRMNSDPCDSDPANTHFCE